MGLRKQEITKMKTKRVLHIIPDFPSGGAEMVVLTYLRKLKDDKECETMAVSLSANQGRLYEKMAADEGLLIEYLGQDIHDSSLMARIRQIRQLRKYIKGKHPNVVHIHLSILWIVCLAITGLRINGVFHTLHSDPSKTSVGKNLYIDRFCYSFYKVKPLCLNREMADVANRIFRRTDAQVLTNGIDLDKYKDLHRSQYRAMYGIPDDAFVLGHVGRFNKVKNHKLIVNVFAELYKQKKDAYLVLVGEGELLQDVIAQAKELRCLGRIVFTGARNDVPELMGMMDVFIFPSLYEGLGIVLIEAQAAGLRCVISKTIPHEAVVRPDTNEIGLNDEPQKWVNAILGNDHNYVVPKKKLADYSAKCIIEKLKGYYKGV